MGSDQLTFFSAMKKDNSEQILFITLPFLYNNSPHTKVVEEY